MTRSTATDVSVETRIDNFIAKKARQFPALGLATTQDAASSSSSLRPLHEILTDRLLAGRDKAVVSSLLALAKSNPLLSSYGRTHLVK